MKTIKAAELVLDQVRQLVRTYAFLGTTVDGMTITATSGTIAALSEAGGGTSLLTQAADNAIAHWTTTGLIFDPTSKKPMYMGARIQFAEAATNAANLFVGFGSGATASILQNNGAGPAASYSGFSFFKVDGGLNWNVEASVGGAQVTAELTATNSLTKSAIVAGKAAYQFLEIEVIPKTTAKCDVMFSVDGVCVYKMTDFTYTSIVPMAAIGAVKAGSATAETLKTSFVNVGQLR
jgi:hypothetical protein